MTSCENSHRVLRGKQVYGARVWVLISRRKLTGLGWLTVRGVRENRAPSTHVNRGGLLNPLGVLAKIAAIRLGGNARDLNK